MKELNQKLAIVQTKLKTKKTSYNAFGKYYFRKAEDILEAIKPFLLEQGITVTISEELIMTDPVPTIKSTATISDGANAIHATAVVGVDLNQKGMQMPQKYGAASSYAKKYALGNLFLIDDTQDADANNTHGSSVVNKLKDKAKQEMTEEAFNKAKEYVSSGGKVSTIETKYKMSLNQRDNLVKLENGQTENTKQTS